MTTRAAVDRVVHHSVILDMMAVESYRAKAASHSHLQQQAVLAMDANGSSSEAVSANIKRSTGKND